MVPLVPSREQLDVFIARLQLLLDRERGAEEEQTRLLNSKCSHKLLEQRGLAIGGVGVAAVSMGLGGKSLIEIVRPSAYHTSPTFPSHTFRNGDPARLESFAKDGSGKGKGKAKDADQGEGVEGIVYRVSSEKITLAVEGEVDLPERLRLIKLANTVTFDRMEKTMTRLQRDLASHSETHLSRVLLGLDKPQHRTIDEPTWLTELNDSQKAAIRHCLSTDSVACIHGPPGTGKTHTLVELIYQLLSHPASPISDKPPRILICTPSNLALDNILLRLYKLSGQAPYSDLLPREAILRIGHPTRVHRELVGVTLDYQTKYSEQGELVRDIGKEIDGHLSEMSRKRGERGAIKGKERGKKWEEIKALRKDYRAREGKVVKTVVANAQVVLATCHSAGTKQLGDAKFDICIIDEATQAVEPVCWVPILKSKRLVLAGDPQQLPPTIKGKAGGDKKGGKEGGEGEKGKANGNGSGTKGKAAQISNAFTTDNEEGDAGLVEGKMAQVEITSRQEPPSDDKPRTTPPETSAAIKTHSITPAPTTSASPHPHLNPRSLEETLFERLEKVHPDIKRVLKVQYRMHNDIASFPSTELYDSELIADPSVAEHTLADILPEADEAGNAGAEADDIPPIVFFDTAGCEFYERSGTGDTDGPTGGDDDSKSNANEAAIVVNWARRLISKGLSPGDIGIVTPYQAQVSLISDLLSTLTNEKNEDTSGITIGSVDGLQGQEREAIILSLVRSNEKGEIGFLGEYRRLNVGMTRAKRHLCVVGDSDTVGKGSGYLGRWMRFLEERAEVRYAGDEV